MGVASLATLWVTVALALFAACGAVETSTAAVTHTNRPVVGVLTLPNFFNEWSDKRSYFPASYVKWLEAGGMRVVPIPFTDSHEDIEEKFQSLNGVRAAVVSRGLIPCGVSMLCVLHTCHRFCSLVVVLGSSTTRPRTAS